MADIIGASSSSRRLVTGLFRDRESAERVYGLITGRGYGMDDVNLLMSDETRRKHFVGGRETEFGNKALEGGGAGAAMGGTVGATLAAIAAIGTSVAMPGLGLIIAGPIAAALAGAGAGGATGGIIGALVGSGIPEERVKDYEEGIRQGGIVMGIIARSDEDADYFDYALKEYLGEHIYSSGGGESGWRSASDTPISDQPVGGSDIAYEVTAGTHNKITEESTRRSGGDTATRSADSTGQEDVESEPSSLYVNLWIDDEEGDLLAEPIRLNRGMTYYFHIAIERWLRQGRGEPFDEPEELREREKSTLVVEVVCPFLNEEGRIGYARREVDYYAGYGFDAETFALQPMAAEKYYLTVRVLFNREILYREIFAIEVTNVHQANARLNVTEAAMHSEKSR